MRAHYITSFPSQYSTHERGLCSAPGGEWISLTCLVICLWYLVDIPTEF
jgi:hypothetical protein